MLASRIPEKPNIRSGELLVVTLLTLGAVAPLVEVADSNAWPSHGAAVFAPETPKATTEASSVAVTPEMVTVITREVSCVVATAYQTSASE